MEQAAIDAIRDGDVAAVRRYLDGLPGEDQLQDPGRALAGEVTRWGGPGFAQLLYVFGAVLPPGPWGEVDPPVWAAEHGASELLKHFLGDYPAPEATLRRALDAARAWLDADPEAELRRRAGVTDGDVSTLTQDHITVDEYEPRARRIRLSTADGRWVEVLAEHRAVVTILEQYLELPISRDALLARALWSADPQSCDWWQSQRAIRARFPAEETFRWAAARLADEDVTVRRFTAELLHFFPPDGETAEGPHAADAVAALRTRLAAETDADTLCSVIGAYAGFSEFGATLHELLPFAADHRPQVRRRVAMELPNGTDGSAGDPPQHILGTMLSLARDPDPTVRAAATAMLVYSAIDAPALRELLAAQMAGEDREVRIHAATGLALRGDAHALAQLRRMSHEDGYDSLAWRQADHVEHVLAQRRGVHREQ